MVALASFVWVCRLGVNVINVVENMTIQDNGDFDFVRRRVHTNWSFSWSWSGTYKKNHVMNEIDL